MIAGATKPLHGWTPSAHWRAIDLISDLHLAPELPLTVRAWSNYLEHTTADAVCMLGDLFEVWVGDDARDQDFERGLVQTLAHAARRRALAFMPGNRDFLVGPDLCAAAGLLALPDPTCLQAWNHRWLLCHGDAQCLDDSSYQSFRAQVRSLSWQQAFLQRPLADRVAMARAMRQASTTRRRDAGEGIGDLDPQACRQLLAQAQAQVMVHGHTHRPAEHDLGGGAVRIVLSDWDLDDPESPRAEVLRLSPDGRARRLSPLDACAR